MEEAQQENNLKLLLMGKSKAGKTSMHSIIFANLSPNETEQIGYTMDINVGKYNFLGMQLMINDCAGQEKLAKFYLSNPDRVFKEVKVLIYVFDVSIIDEPELDMFNKTVEQLKKFSPNAKIFVLIHKMDIVQRRQEVFLEKKALIEKSSARFGQVSEFFATSIWDVTLYNVSLADPGLEQDHPDPHPEPAVPQRQPARGLRDDRVRRDHPLREVHLPHHRLPREDQRPQEYLQVRTHFHHRQALQDLMQQGRLRDLQHGHTEPQLQSCH